jgi:hypothetical protein
MIELILEKKVYECTLNTSSPLTHDFFRSVPSHLPASHRGNPFSRHRLFR